MKHFRSVSQKRGNFAEEIVAKHLKKSGYHIISRNVAYKHGEIDIVAKEGQVLCFIEVKSAFVNSLDFVSCETYNPLQNITRSKIQKIQKAAISFLREKYVSYETYRFDACSISISKHNSRYKIEYIKNAF